jgi:hypothetical protein
MSACEARPLFPICRTTLRMSCLFLYGYIQLLVDETADCPRMISDFFYPQPGGVESHIYQLSSVGDLLFDHSTSNYAYTRDQQQLTFIRN